MRVNLLQYSITGDNLLEAFERTAYVLGLVVKKEEARKDYGFQREEPYLIKFTTTYFISAVWTEKQVEIVLQGDRGSAFGVMDRYDILEFSFKRINKQGKYVEDIREGKLEGSFWNMPELVELFEKFLWRLGVELGFYEDTPGGSVCTT